MANNYPVAGMRIYIGGVLAKKNSDWVAADFAGQSWTEIGGWETMGPLGDAVADIVTPLINTGRDDHQKGTASSPTRSDVFVAIDDDAGQILLVAAGQPSNKNNYAFRVDGNESGVSTVSKRYFMGVVMGTPEQGGGANTARKISATTQPNSNIVRVAAVP